jgi:hypothetical protein
MKSSSSSCNSSPPHAMLVLSTNLIIHRCIELGSIKFSLNKRPISTKSEFIDCSNSFACALVIGPILTSLDFFATTSSSSIGVGDNGVVIAGPSRQNPWPCVKL